MPETIHETLQSETVTETVHRHPHRPPTHFVDPGTQPLQITKDAAHPVCSDHPDANSYPGLGYAGGGFGVYRRCVACDRVFGKVALKDGNDV